MKIFASLLAAAAMLVATPASADGVLTITLNQPALVSNASTLYERRVSTITLHQPALVRNAFSFYVRMEPGATFDDFLRLNLHLVELGLDNLSSQLEIGDQFNIPSAELG